MKNKLLAIRTPTRKGSPLLNDAKRTCRNRSGGDDESAHEIDWKPARPTDQQYRPRPRSKLKSGNKQRPHPTFSHPLPPPATPQQFNPSSPSSASSPQPAQRARHPFERSTVCPPTRRQSHEDQTKLATKLGDTLSIGSIGAAHNENSLHGVTVVVSLERPRAHIYFKPIFPEGITYQNHHDIPDKQSTFILPTIKEVATHHLGNDCPHTLIHCQQGQSRAATVTIGLCLYTLRYRPEKLPVTLAPYINKTREPQLIVNSVIQWLKAQHPRTKPNESFTLQLRHLANLLFGSDPTEAAATLERNMPKEKALWIDESEPLDPKEFPLKEALVFQAGLE